MRECPIHSLGRLVDVGPHTAKRVSKTDLTRYLPRPYAFYLLDRGLVAFLPDRWSAGRAGSGGLIGWTRRGRGHSFLGLGELPPPDIYSRPCPTSRASWTRRGRRPDGRGGAAAAGLRRAAQAGRRAAGPGEAGPDAAATALVHEAYLRLVDVATAQHWNSRGHFFAAAAEAMRRILVEQGPPQAASQTRRRATDRCPSIPRPGRRRLRRDEELLALDDCASTGSPATIPQAAQLVKLRYFAGLSVEEAAAGPGHLRRHGLRHWAFARPRWRVLLELPMRCRPDKSHFFLRQPSRDPSHWRVRDSKEVPHHESRKEPRAVFFELCRQCAGGAVDLRLGRGLRGRRRGVAPTGGSVAELPTGTPAVSSDWRRCPGSRWPPSTSRFTKAPAPSSARTSCWSRSARAASASSSWPSRPSRSAARSP